MGWNRLSAIAAGLLAATLVVSWLLGERLLAVVPAAALLAAAWLWFVGWRRRRRLAARRPPPREHIPRAVREMVYARDGYTCRYCGRERGHAVRLELDHFYPVARGGSDDPDNLVTACRACNRAKGVRILRDEAAVRRFVAEREVVIAALARSDRRRVLWRDLFLTALVLVIVLATYVVLTRLVL
jgi:hypothetical protein